MGSYPRWAATNEAFRCFDNPRVTEHSVLAGHFAATAARVSASERPIIAILQDTTEFSTAARSRQDRLHQNHQRRRDETR
ncbi:hypothetical protein X747_32895 [Mesorhizobium sp. LNJC384A00]|nr:hypothetical protein X747_32895 [Mesorhizobium sp. LNJC384A00]